MGLVQDEVEINLSSNNIKYYENLGYYIPRYKDKKNRSSVKLNTKMIVKVKDIPKGSHIKIKCICDECDKECFIIYQSYLKHNHNGKTYCKKCGYKLFATGENHPNYNPNITQKEREINRDYTEYDIFIKKVLVRDNYTCQCCSKNLNKNGGAVHHLDGYNWCKEKRTDETNGITLCKNCHSNFHSIYGNGNNTKEQYEEWIGYTIGELEKYDGELPSARKVYCIEEDKIYNSIERLAKEWQLKNNTYIYRLCNHIEGVTCVKNKHLFWLDEYLKLSKNEINNYININTNKKYKKVICLTTGKIFDKINDAEEYYGFIKDRSKISEVCKGKRKTCGKLEDGTKLEWMYYEENNCINLDGTIL